MSDTLKLSIGTSRKKVKITNVTAEKYCPTDRNPKVHISTVASDGAPFKITEVWVRNHKDEVVPKGLWVNPDDSGEALHKESLLAKLLAFLGVTNTGEMIGKEVLLEPKDNGYMAIVMYE